MHRVLLAGLLLPFPLFAQEAATGRIEGTVKFTGEVPPPQKILTSDGATLLHRDLVVDPKNKGLRFVAVVIENAPKGSSPAAEPVMIDQRDMQFIPRVVAVQEGRKVRIENNDLCNHAVQGTSIIQANQFNVLTPMGQPFETTLKADKHPVTLGCPLHTWMRAYIFVHSHPFFAVTDAEGRFCIDGLPPGEYSLLFRHPDTGLKEKRTVRVEPDKAATVEVTWDKAK
jgi:plastocyanin